MSEPAALARHASTPAAAAVPSTHHDAVRMIADWSARYLLLTDAACDRAERLAAAQRSVAAAMEHEALVR